MNYYDNKFYALRKSRSYRSDQQIFPLLFDLIKPKSAIDIGCGIGTWLQVLESEYSVKDILGVDGEYAKSGLIIDEKKFISYDLKNYFKSPKKYDLAISVEVGEHLPHSSADNFVASLTDAADIVLFSAALPGQTGTYHINEQFPEYWAEKFIKRGFLPIDLFRKKIWHNDTIEWWYRQNILLFVKESMIPNLPEEIKHKLDKTDPEFLTRIHPGCINYLHDELNKRKTLLGFIRCKLYFLKKKFK